MTTAMTLFGSKVDNQALALLDGYEDNLTSTLAGGGGGHRRLSIRGGVFRMMSGKNEVAVSEDRAINVVLVNAAPIARTYYGKQFVEGENSGPVCWSVDAVSPDAKVPADQKQASKCSDCPMNIKGSGQGDTRACRYSQRVAVVLDGAIDKREIYQLSLPATSVFGDAEDGKMPLQAYARHLKAHNTHIISIVTEMRFDISSAVPKLSFKPVRPLNADELKTVLDLRDHPDTIEAITFTVSEREKAAETPAPAEKPATKKATTKKAETRVEDVIPVAEAEEVDEPVKAEKKSAPKPEPVDLDSLIDDWDD